VRAALLLLLECLRGARQIVLAHEGAVDDRLDEVGLEAIRRHRRLELESQGVERGRSPLEVAHLLLEVERHEALHTRAMRIGGLVGGIEEADG
jgi:hypothetical protein